MSEPTEAEMRAAITAAIEAWKNARQLPYLSPSACQALNDLILAGLRPVLARVRIKRHTPEGIPDSGSYEVRFADGRPSVYFYWDDDAGRRAVRNVDDSATALVKAQQLARDHV